MHGKNLKLTVMAFVFMCDLLGKRPRNFDLIPVTDTIFFCCPHPADRPWGPTPFVSNKYGGLLPEGKGVGK